MQRSIKIGICCAVICLTGIVIGFLVFPKLLRNQINNEVSLKPGSESRAMWTRLPFPMEFKIYLFNVTNPEEVQTGGKPKIKEIGPYCYDHWKEKINQVDDEKEDSITFNMKTTWFFNKEMSAPLTGDELITTPHPFILGLGIKVAETKPGMTGIVNKALQIIYDNQTNIFLTATAKEILFDGFTIGCNKEQFAAQAVCIAMQDEGKGLMPQEDETLKYSFFGHRNNSAEDLFTISRGIRNPADLGRVLRFRDSPTLSMWPMAEQASSGNSAEASGTNKGKGTKKGEGMSRCSRPIGTDSTIFPPFLQPQQGLWSFSADVCRSTQAVFERDTVYEGIPVRRYNATFGDPKKDPSIRCYCPKEPKPCPLAGTFDLSPCLQAPITASLPHFYAADPRLQEGVIGLNPDKDKHGIFVEFESITGKPLSARKRLQFNMELMKVEKLDLLSELSGSLLPLFWVEEGIALNETYTGMLENKLFRTLRYVHYGRWALVILGAFGMLAAALLYYKDRNTRFSVTPTTLSPNEKIAVNTISAGPGQY